VPVKIGGLNAKLNNISQKSNILFFLAKTAGDNGNIICIFVVIKS
jgi:hypothetical protein